MRPSVEWLHRRAARAARHRRAHPLPRLSRRRSRSSSGSSSRARSRRCSTRSVTCRPRVATPPAGRPLAPGSSTTILDARRQAAASSSLRARASSTPRSRSRRRLFEMLVGIFFMFAVGAYWIFERDRHDRARAVDGAAQAPAGDARHVGAHRPEARRVRTRPALLIVFVAVLLSLALLLDGEPYWLLIGCFAGVVEIVPVIGPLAAGALADRRRRSPQSWHMARLRRHRRARPCASSRTTSSRRGSWATRSGSRRCSCSSR